MGVVEVWREPSQFWRWRYTEPPSGDETIPLELFSNEVYETSQEAIEAATTAYPGTAVLELDRPPGAPAEQPRGAGRGRRRRLVLLGVALGLLAVRARRRRRRARSG